MGQPGDVGVKVLRCIGWQTAADHPIAAVQGGALEGLQDLGQGIRVCCGAWHHKAKVPATLGFVHRKAHAGRLRGRHASVRNPFGIQHIGQLHASAAAAQPKGLHRSAQAVHHPRHIDAPTTGVVLRRCAAQLVRVHHLRSGGEHIHTGVEG